MTTKSFIKTIGEKGLLADYNTEGEKLQTELIAGDNVTIDGSTISSDQVFVATYGTTTYQEVKDAYDAGKICIAQNGDVFWQLYAVTSRNIRFIMHNPVTKTALSYNVDTKSMWTSYGYTAQPQLTFDTTPTAGSTNPVTSDGIKTALDGKQDSLPTSGTASSTYAIDISGNSTSANKWRGSIYGIATSANTKRYVYLGRKRKSSFGCLIGILTVCSHVDSKDVYIINSGWSDGNFGNNATVQRISSGGASEPINICLYNHEITENGKVYSELWCYIPTNSNEVDFIFRTLFNFVNSIAIADSVVNRAESEFTGTLTKCANSNSRNTAYSPTNTAVGSASVPVYVRNNGAVTACTDDFVHKTALDSRIPAPTSTTGTQVLKCINGVVQWVNE